MFSLHAALTIEVVVGERLPVIVARTAVVLAYDGRKLAGSALAARRRHHPDIPVRVGNIVGRVFYRRLDDRLLEGPGIDTFDRQPLLLADQPRADPARFRNIFLAHEHIAVLAR